MLVPNLIVEDWRILTVSLELTTAGRLEAVTSEALSWLLLVIDVSCHLDPQLRHPWNATRNLSGKLFGFLLIW